MLRNTGQRLRTFWFPAFHSEYAAVGKMTGKPRSQYGAIMVFVKQTFQVGIVLLVLLAIFGVLLTPDPSDDPAGVTVRLDKSRLLVTSLLATPAVSLPPLTPASRIIFSRTQIATTIAKRDLICTRLC
jgi:hypothetical protein